MMGNRYLYTFLPVSNPLLSECVIMVKYHPFSDLKYFFSIQIFWIPYCYRPQFCQFRDHLIFLIPVSKNITLAFQKLIKRNHTILIFLATEL